MTAADLLMDPEFLAFCSIWERDGRCPLVFADWLRDRGLDGQADGAGWAATEPKIRKCGDFGQLIGPSPMPVNPERWSGGKWAWFGKPFTQTADEIPGDIYRLMTGWLEKSPDGASFRTFSDSIAAFLDAWALARAPATA